MDCPNMSAQDGTHSIDMTCEMVQYGLSVRLSHPIRTGHIDVTCEVVQHVY